MGWGTPNKGRACRRRTSQMLEDPRGDLRGRAGQNLCCQEQAQGNNPQIELPRFPWAHDLKANLLVVRIRCNLTAMSIVAKNKQLKEPRAKGATKAKAMEARLNEELANLPTNYGFESVADFFAAVTKAVRTLGKHAGRPATEGKGREKVFVPFLTRAERSKRTIAGMQAARRRGTQFGRPPLDPKVVRRIHAAAARMGHRVRAIARTVEVSPSSVSRVLAKGR